MNELFTFGLKLIKNIILITLSLLFFIFEDIIWNLIVIKVINKIKELHFYQTYIEWLQNQNKYFILVIF